MPSAPKHFLQFGDFSRDEFDYLFERTRWIKDRFKRYELYQPLRDRTLAMVFEKASTRTRVSFEAGMNQLGGIAINLNRGDTQLSRGEPIEDVARVISRMVDVVMIRTFEQSIIERFAAHSRVPVINGLTNEYHPCQILADIYTYVEHRGSIAGKTVAWIGDSNNVCNTWLQAARDLRLPRPRVHAARLRDRQLARADRRGRDSSSSSPIRSRRAAAPTSSPPTCGPAWASKPRTTSAASAFADWMVDADMMRAGEAGRAVHALPACASRRGSRRRGDRRSAERRLGRGGEPAARAEGAARVSGLRRAIEALEETTMIDHTGVTVSQPREERRAFYRAALAPLGYAMLMEFEESAGLRRRAEVLTSGSANGRLRRAARRTSRSRADTRCEVDAFHRAALAAGGRDNGAPGLRPHYHPNYYGAFVLDPDGHNVEAVCHRAA